MMVKIVLARKAYCCDFMAPESPEGVFKRTPKVDDLQNTACMNDSNTAPFCRDPGI